MQREGEGRRSLLIAHSNVPAACAPRIRQSFLLVVACTSRSFQPLMFIPDCLRVPTARHAERRVQTELAKIWERRAERDALQHPSLRVIPRLHLRKPVALSAQRASAHAELAKMACTRVREQMASLVLDARELEEVWVRLKQNLSPPISLGAASVQATCSASAHYCCISSQPVITPVKVAHAPRRWACSCA